MAPNFALGKVYAVRNTVNDKVYVGSTVRTLAQRMADHRLTAATAPNEKEYPMYVAMREIGIDKFYVELIVDCPCDRRETLNREEGKHIRELNTIAPNGYNSQVAGRTPAEHRMDHKEEYKARDRAYYEAHKDIAHTYYVANSETIKAKANDRYAANAEAIKAKVRERYAANAEANKAKVRERRAANADAINAKRREQRAAAKANKNAELTA